MIPFLAVALLSYFAGSIPFGFLIGKIFKGIDLRDHGSGNIGATNAGRVLGKTWGIVCLILDALKGLLPVAFLPQCFFAADSPWLDHVTVLAGVMTIIGHMFPCWLGFRGGKGVATSFGVLAILSPWGVAVAAGLFFTTLLIARFVSLSSMLAALGYAGFEFWRLQPSPFSDATWSRACFAVLVPMLIIIQHRSNIRRLLAGEEPKLTARNQTTSPSELPN